VRAGPPRGIVPPTADPPSPGRRTVLALAGSLLAGGLAPPSARAGVEVSVRPAAPRPGDVVLVRIAGAPPDARLDWDGHAVPLFPVADGWGALVGVDLDTRPGPVGWRVTRPSRAKNGGALAAGAVTVGARSFPTQHLTLPRAMVDLDAPTLARVQAEREALQAALADSAGAPLWRGPFRMPVEGGQPTGGFGLRRLINGQPRSPHAGYDWAAPVGTPVLAANAGRVVLVAEHFFAGRNVVVDHGLGLFTLYYHLDEARVAPGTLVTAGQVLGTVGATGRVTGPHLHLAVLLRGARVDPESLLALPLPGP
jgi:murein DD-endopeptidase MepM/ murein hydrolase activator NlpD